MINQAGKRGAPDRGSFPLDHFRVCEEQVIRFNECMEKHGMMPKRCQRFQKNYLECRMKGGLMKPQSLENLGFTAQNTWENEQQKKERLFRFAVELDKRSTNNVRRLKGLPYWDNNVYQV